MAKRILRPMGYRDILDETFDLYKRNFFLFAGIACITQTTLGVLRYFIITPTVRNSPHVWDNYDWFALINLPLLEILVATVTWAASGCYTREKPTIYDSYKAVFSKIVPLLLTSVLALIMTIIGTMLFCIPGIAMLVLSVFITPVILFEGKAYFAAISRGFQLFRYGWVRIVVLGVLTMVIGLTAWYFIRIPFHFLDPVTRAHPFRFINYNYGIISMIGEIVSGTLIQPISIASTLLYYDFRVRKEGF